jgi:hypothetical protein
MEQKRIWTFLRRSAEDTGWRSFGLVLALTGLSLRSEAGSADLSTVTPLVIEQPSSPFRATVIEENPTFALFGRDRHYTNGFKLAITSGQLADDSIWNAPIRLLRQIYVFNQQTNGTDDRPEWTRRHKAFLLLKKWRFNHDLGNAYSWEVIPGVELAAGNIFTYAGVSALARWGRGLKADWGPDMIRPGYAGTSYFSPERGGVALGFDMYLGIQGGLYSVCGPGGARL